MHNYEGGHGRLPPAAVRGKDGQPLLSWRVLLLPYLEVEPLYQEFHFDEPWDSPHNLALLPRMPEIYAAPGSKARRIPPYYTYLHVFTGQGTAFEDPQGELLKSFTDGTSNTILVVEAGEAVPWTKPQELPYAPGKPLPTLDGPFDEGFRAGFADGSVHFIKKETSEELLRATITRNGGEVYVPEW